MYFFKNGLINKVIDESLGSWSHTLDAGDFVQPQFLRQIDKKIFKNMQKQFKELEIFNLLWLEEKGFKLGLWQKLCIWFSGLKPLWLSYKQEMIAAMEKAAEQEVPPEPQIEVQEASRAEPVAPQKEDPFAWDLDAEIEKEKELRNGKKK